MLADRIATAQCALQIFAVRCYGYCRHPVSICASVTFVSCAKTNKDIFEFFTVG